MLSLQDVIQLGDPRLRRQSTRIPLDQIDQYQPVWEGLHQIILAFRRKYQAGRGVAAPQVGCMKRLIYILWEDTPMVIINPVLSFLSEEKFELWDDCMSFPQFLVKVERYRHCQIDYYDQLGNPQSIQAEDDLAELLQHEYDHLNGVLAIDRAVNPHSFKWKKID